MSLEFILGEDEVEFFSKGGLEGEISNCEEMGGMCWSRIGEYVDC